jgi:hypothetical protein
MIILTLFNSSLPGLVLSACKQVSRQANNGHFVTNLHKWYIYIHKYIPVHADEYMNHATVTSVGELNRFHEYSTTKLAQHSEVYKTNQRMANVRVNDNQIFIKSKKHREYCDVNNVNYMCKKLAPWHNAQNSNVSVYHTDKTRQSSVAETTFPTSVTRWHVNKTTKCESDLCR